VVADRGVELEHVITLTEAGLLDISRRSSGHPGPRDGMSPADRVDGLSPCRNSGSAFDRFGWIVRWCFGVQLRGCRPGYRGTGGATADLFPTRIRRKHGGTNRTNSQPYPIGLAYGLRVALIGYPAGIWRYPIRPSIDAGQRMRSEHRDRVCSKGMLASGRAHLRARGLDT